ncbi:hypothetical protein AX15_004242 [Amanita polypyramis BW_CC]|nr:hypothetical protein AX15_004242 [Amanita polypyramis BW_CC]
MQGGYRPNYHRSFPGLPTTTNEDRMPTMTGPQPNRSVSKGKMHVRRVTLTSKKNWWMVEMDEEEENTQSSSSFSPSEETVVEHSYRHGADQAYHLPDHSKAPSTPAPSPIYFPPRHPASLFSFPTPTAYCAPPNPTASLIPCAHGSASELFKCVVKQPDVVQVEINDEMQSNASDVTVQFLAELRVYTTLARHRNICAFLGSLENVGMVLEYVEGRTLYDVVIARPALTKEQKIDYHNQLLDGLTHLHSYRLSHGDLSLLNIQVTTRSNTIKLLDFGRSVCADSEFVSPHEEPVDPFTNFSRKSVGQSPFKGGRVEQIHPGTRPFCAPEILRGECRDPLLADAYSFGVILVCLDRCESVDMKPWEQRKDKVPDDLFEGCEVFRERAGEYVRRWDAGRRRLGREDMVVYYR